MDVYRIISPIMFLSLPSSSPLFLPRLLFYLILSPPVAATERHYQLCGETNYTANSTYETNLNILLPSLVSNASLTGGFSSAMIGKSPNQTYGLAICRGDINASRCLSCLDTASHEIVHVCLDKIEAVILYEPCLLRFSNVWSLATTEAMKQISLWNIFQITKDRPLFGKLRDELLSAIADWAAYNTTMRFATGEVNFTTDFPTIYGLVQCTPDLWADPCRQCLQDIFEPLPSIFEGKKGARVLQVRCSYRYEVYQFYYVPSMLKLGSRTPAPATLVPPHVKPPALRLPPPVNPGKGTKITSC